MAVTPGDHAGEAPPASQMAPAGGAASAPGAVVPAATGAAPAATDSLPELAPGSALAEAIFVANELWSSSNTAAHGGGHAPSITHLAEFEEIGERGDDARWSSLQVVPAKADIVLDLLRVNSLWPLLSGLSCCAFEMMSSATSRNDIDRFNMFPFRASPRQADVLIVAGTLTTKMAGPLLRLWEEMPEPKWCVAMGDCTVSGGRFKRSYSVVQGIDRIMPVDVYVPGCPPRPEGLIYGMLKLQRLILERRGRWSARAVGPTVPAGR